MNGALGLVCTIQVSSIFFFFVCVQSTKRMFTQYSMSQCSEVPICDGLSKLKNFKGKNRKWCNALLQCIV